MTRERSVFFYSDGLKISGVLHVPKTLKKGRRLAAVVVCYGYCDFMDNPWVVETCERLNRIGVAALRFDYRGNGVSEGLRGRIICSDEARDVQNAVTFLETRSEVDEDRIGFVGFSLGGANAIYLSAVDDRVKCTVSIAGVGNGERWLHECFRLNRSEAEWQEFLELLRKDRKTRVKTGKSRFVDALEVMPSPPNVVKLALDARKISHPPRSPIDRVPLETGESIINYRPEDFARTIRCPILLIHGDSDDLVSATQSKSIYAKAKCVKKLIIIPGADHFLMFDPTKPIFDQTANTVLSWIRRNLCS